MLDFLVKFDISGTYYDRIVIIRHDLFSCRGGRILIPLPSSCSGKVDESSFYISSYELNANSISDIKTFKSFISFPFTGGWNR